MCQITPKQEGSILPWYIAYQKEQYIYINSLFSVITAALNNLTHFLPLASLTQFLLSKNSAPNWCLLDNFFNVIPFQSILKLVKFSEITTLIPWGPEKWDLLSLKQRVNAYCSRPGCACQTCPEIAWNIPEWTGHLSTVSSLQQIPAPGPVSPFPRYSILRN